MTEFLQKYNIFTIFVAPKSKNIMNNKTNILPVWYGGGMRKHLNTRFYSVGHLNRYGLYIS